MRILWLTWKDRKNPAAGGAELFNEELAKKMVQAGHEVIFLVAGFRGAAATEIINSYKIIRVGNKWTVYWQASRYYKKNLLNWADVVIEEINTVPFFTQFYLKKTPRYLFFHQLAREIWFYEIFFPLSLIGYLLEPIYLYFLRQNKVITVSQSTKNDLLNYGFKPQSITVIGEGLEIKPLKNLTAIKKYPTPTLLSLGNLRAMKRTLEIVKAFELAKKTLPNLKLKIAGEASGHYGQKVLRAIKKSIYHQDIEYLGKITLQEKNEILEKSHLIAVTSVKEGWGLIVSEAAAKATPAVVYNVDGLRDAVFQGRGGYLTTNNTPANLAAALVAALSNQTEYQQKQKFAWEASQKLTFDRSYAEFMVVVEKTKAPQHD